MSGVCVCVCPVYWPYDYTLRLYPVPDLIVFSDKYDPFSVSNTDCLCINPVRINVHMKYECVFDLNSVVSYASGIFSEKRILF